MKFNPLFILLSFVLLLIYSQWLLPGPRVATDFSQVSESILKSKLDLPQTWTVFGTEGLGEYTAFTLWSWQFNLIYSLFASLGLSFAYLERLLIIIPFLVIGSISIWKLLSKYIFSDYAKFAATIFYLSNTYILLVIDGGQLSISLSYAFFPLCFLMLENSIEGKLRQRVLLGLVVTLMGSFDIRFIFVLSILAFLRFIFEFLFLNKNKWISWTLKWLSIASVSGLIVIGLNFFWIYILYKSPPSSISYAYFTQTSFDSLISLGHAILFLSPHWFKNIFGQVTNIRWEFIGIPILVFCTAILRPRSKIVGFWLVVALVSIFLTKGPSGPFPQIYPWIYHNIPGFSLFRDSSKFFFLISLAYTILLGIAVDEFFKRFKNFRMKLGLMIIVISYLIVIIKPVWLGEMTGTFSPPAMQKEFMQLDKLISVDKKKSNVLWIPTISPLTILNSDHPALEAVRIASSRPFAQANLGTYEKFNFIREAHYMGEIFNILNIGYIVYPPLNPKRGDLKQDNIEYYNLFLNQLSNLSWISRVNQSEIPIFRVKQTQDKLFIVPNVWWVIGSDSIYRESTLSSQLKLSKNSLIFVEESQDLGRKIDEVNFSNIILNDKTVLDLIASFFNKSNLIFPASILDHDPDDSRWWKRDTNELIEWKNFLSTKYGINNQDFDLGGGWAVAEGDLSLKIYDEKIKTGRILLARVLESTRSGEVGFYQGGKEIGRINTKKPKENVRWFEVGLLKDKSPIIIKTQGDINVVNTLAVLNEEDLHQYKNKAEKYKYKILNFSEDNIKENPATLTYKQLSPTKYTVTVKGLNKPAMLIFAQNFDKRWKLNGKASLPMYSVVNGFILEKDGQYELEFESQKYVIQGMVISVIVLFLCLILLLV